MPFSQGGSGGSGAISGVTVSGTAAANSIILASSSSAAAWSALPLASYTPSTTGITGESVALCVFTQIGGLVFFVYSSSGTGSTTARTFTLPVSTGANGGQYGGMMWLTKDGGVTGANPGVWVLSNSSSTCTLFKTASEAAGSWTASGAWQVAIAGWYGTN